ncbi:MAG: hypothetical protein WBB49_03130 [Microgenomates group bacterium]|jgi:hypothetical protein|nr:MAG: hypothetical protein IPH70_02380 [Candidatus Roizmanbacteria bacterium]
MARIPSKSVKWIKIILKIQIYTVIFLVLSISLLAAFQPAVGYTPGNGFIGDFYYGFLARLQGQSYNSTYPIFLDNPGRIIGYFTYFAIFPSITLFALNKKMRKLFLFGAIFSLLMSLGNSAPLGIVMFITILVLAFKKSAKHYFTT